MKIFDRIYHCQIPGQAFDIWQLRCQLRIFQLHGEMQTVMITDASLETDMNFDMDWFVPFLVDKLINDVVSKFHLNPAKLIWIEHCPPTFRKPSCANFSQVTFDWYNGQATNPQWIEIAPQTAQALINEELLVV